MITLALTHRQILTKKIAIKMLKNAFQSYSKFYRFRWSHSPYTQNTIVGFKYVIE